MWRDFAVLLQRTCCPGPQTAYPSQPEQHDEIPWSKAQIRVCPCGIRGNGSGFDSTGCGVCDDLGPPLRLQVVFLGGSSVAGLFETQEQDANRPINLLVDMHC